jgi:hypothetical protein
MDHQAIAELLGNYGEFIGSIAILVTLGYLAIQVRQSKHLLERQQKLAQSQVHQMRMSERIHIEMRAAESEEFASLIVKSSENAVNLSPVDRMRLRGYASANIAIQENNLYQAELDLIDDSTLRGTVEIVNTMMPLWARLGLTIPPRISACYDDSKTPSD